MYKFMTKYGTMAAFGLGLLITVIGLVVIMGGMDTFNALPEEEQSTTSIFNLMIGGAIVLVILCAVLMLGFGIYHIASNPKNALRSLIGLGVIVGLVIVFYSISEAETSGPVYTAIQEGELSENTSKWINGALSTMLILLGGAALAFIASEVRNLFK
ncbi:MAG: hypothetical protein R3301_00360 [Saprospiraceae bacterium]|nr:hypothetical protein [Saprospiraceae bacterium]